MSADERAHTPGVIESIRLASGKVVEEVLTTTRFFKGVEVFWALIFLFIPFCGEVDALVTVDIGTKSGKASFGCPHFAALLARARLAPQ